MLIVIPPWSSIIFSVTSCFPYEGKIEVNVATSFHLSIRKCPLGINGRPSLSELTMRPHGCNDLSGCTSHLLLVEAFGDSTFTTD
ncbi:hypothetical protein O9992_30740 [Vibrio lentus]|nr:hypothetical protein [Vibrio lentus]